jgi:hypothetical protein
MTLKVGWWFISRTCGASALRLGLLRDHLLSSSRQVFFSADYVGFPGFSVVESRVQKGSFPLNLLLSCERSGCNPEELCVSS